MQGLGFSRYIQKVFCFYHPCVQFLGPGEAPWVSKQNLSLHMLREGNKSIKVFNEIKRRPGHLLYPGGWNQHVSWGSHLKKSAALTVVWGLMIKTCLAQESVSDVEPSQWLCFQPWVWDAGDPGNPQWWEVLKDKIGSSYSATCSPRLKTFPSLRG